MPKNIEDIVVPERRKSIRNIPIPENRRKSVKLDGFKKHSGDEGPEDRMSPPSPPRFKMPRRRGNFRRRLWGATGIALLILIFTALSFFNGATLSYVPRFIALTFDNEIFSAKKTADSGLLYSVVKLSGEKNLSVPASGEKAVERKASGIIVVYNDASTEPQRLIENTRFESSAGKVYRIANAITIPGKRTVSGISQPGSLEVTVHADEPGEEFNASLTDFTVPGLKGTSRYSTIYARSKTAMTGGFIGVEKSVNATDLESAQEKLQALLSGELLTKAQAEVPSDFILFPALASIVFEDLVQSSSSSENSATVNLKANLYGVMFKRSDLARELSKNKATISPEERVELKSFDALQISFAGATPVDLLSATEVNFKIAGEGRLVWLTDEAALKSDLVGRPKEDISDVLKNYPTIASASATIRPFWKGVFPEDSGKISIKKLKVE
ncbi:MAG: hypothetical protein HYT69_02030 [Candidatus Zambryskibacteria bacterium]|nr:hypothetical protein [Candidatus Zambryskibacteria bacterium]